MYVIGRVIGTLQRATAGISPKVDNVVYIITPTRRYKSILVAEDLVFVDIEGHTIEGKRKPSGEMPMYLNFFNLRPDIRSAVHCHPPWTNAFTLMKKN